MKRVIVVAAIAVLVTNCERSPVAPEIRLTPQHKVSVIHGPLTQVSAGNDFSCAIGSDGHVACWGYNLDFKATAPPQKLVSQISSGFDHSCGVVSDGTVTCWGAYWVLGGTAPANGVFVQVSAGDDHDCAIRSDGTMACWREHGPGGWTALSGTFLQVSAGAGETCAIDTDHALTCWGISGGPELPSGTFEQVSVGKSLTDCAIATDRSISCWGASSSADLDAPTGEFVEIGVGQYFACALRTNGTIACWGNNANGTATPPSGTFAQLSVGRNHSCALRVEGTVECWGVDSFEAVSGAPAGSFVQVALGGWFGCGVSANGGLSCWGNDQFQEATPPAGSYVQTTVGFYHGCAIGVDATIRCWGRNDAGQATPPTGTFRQVSAASTYTCGLRRDRSVACWGDLADGRESVPNSAFEQISAGGGHACGLKSDGTLTCWGNNLSGQATAPEGTFTQVSTGSSNTCALNTTGSIVCWGSNHEGESSPPTGTFTKVTLGSSNGCALRPNGTISCWGYPQETLRPPTGEFTDISAGGGQICALKWDQSMECWGYVVTTNVVPGNRPPLITTLGGPYTGIEGTVLTFSAAARDPDGDALTYTWDFGDGSSALGAEVTHAFADDNPGGYDVTLTVADAHSQPSTGHVTAKIANAAPRLAALGDVPSGYNHPVCNGTETAFARGGAFTDAGSGDTWSVSVDWGDGSALQSISPSVPPRGIGREATGDFLLAHCFHGGGTYTITVSISDDDGGTDQLSTEFVANRQPLASVGGPYAGSEGTTVALALGASDPDGDVLSYSWNLGDGTVGTGGAPPAGHAYSDNGTYGITLTVTDPHGLSDTKAATVMIVNVAPTATWSRPTSLNEGSPYTMTLTHPMDPSSADVSAGFTFAFDCGAGAGYGAWGILASASCATTDNGIRAARAKIRDKDGGETEYAAPIVVNNVAPTLSALSGPLDPQSAGRSVSVSGSYTDPGTADTHTASVDWGDGTAAGTAADGTASGTHIYSSPGVYTVRMSVTDDDGGVSNESVYRYIVIYDASAGFVTGGGWFSSPSGAYASNPGVTGKATFGFVAKYQKGSSTPTGETEFEFKAGNLTFNSASYEWLVVGGNRARFKGEGSINGGTTAYSFSVTAIDGAISGGGGADAIRVKIWNKSTGTMVYDNRMGASDDGADATTLGGGSIVIHQ